MRYILSFILLFLSEVSIGQNYLHFNHEGKWGTITQEGIVVIKPSFASISPFTNGFAIAKLNGRTSIIDTTGKVLFPFVYFEIKMVESKGDQMLWIARKNRGFYLINEENEQLSQAYFNSIDLHDEFYVGEKDEGYVIGTIGDTTNVTEVFQNVAYKDGAFLCVRQDEKVVLNRSLMAIASGDITKVESLANCLIVQTPGKSSLYTENGKLLVEQIEYVQLVGNQIIAYDMTEGKYFLYNENAQNLTYLNDEAFLGQYLDYLVFSKDKQLILRAPDGSKSYFDGYNQFDEKYGFLLLGKEDSQFDVLNKNLEIIVSNTDLIKKQDSFYLYRKDELYGLFNEREMLFKARYKFFETSSPLAIKAYPTKGLLYVEMSNGREVERTFFPNFVSLKAYGSIAATTLNQNGVGGRQPFNSGQSTSINHFWVKDTLRYENPDNNRAVWGIKKDTFLVPPRYSNYNLLNEQFSLGYYFSNAENVRVFGNVPTNKMFDMIDHVNGVKLNEKPYYSFARLFPNNNVYIVRNRKNISIHGPNLNTLHDRVPYVNTSGRGPLYPYCFAPKEIKFSRKELAPKYAISTITWLTMLRDNNTFPLKIDFEEIEMISFYKGRWGYINDSARVVIDAKYDFTHPMDLGVGIGVKDGKYGAVNYQKEILPAVYDRLNVIRLSDSIFVRAMKYPSAKAIYIDSFGNAKDAQYKALISSWKNDNAKLITVQENNSYGMVDKQGELIIPVTLTMEPIVKDKYIITRINKCGVHDFEGNQLVEHAYRWVESYRDGFVVFRERNKFGVGDRDGNIILDADFDLIELGDQSIYCERSNFSAVFDYNGEQMSKENWEYSYFDEETEGWIYRKNKNTVVDYKGQTLRYDGLNRSIRFFGDYLLVESKSGEYNLHLIDEELTPVFSESFDRIEKYNDSIFMVYERGQFGLRNVKDQQIVPIRYRNLVEVFDNVLAGISSDRLKVFDLQGNVLFERNASIVLKSENNCFLVKDKKGASFYDSNMKNIFFRSYENATSFKNGFASVQIDGFWTVINQFGDEMFQPCYGSIVPIGENIFYAKNRYLTGLFDTYGNEVLPVKYDEIIAISDKILRVIDDGSIGYYHIEGQWLIEPGFIPSELSQN